MEFPMIVHFSRTFRPSGSTFMCFTLLILPNLAPFYTVSFSRHPFHFAADFVTLSYIKTTIFPNPFSYYTASSKKAPLWGEASPYRPL